MNYGVFHSFIGEFFILEQEERIIALHQNFSLLPSNTSASPTPLLQEAMSELRAYFKGELKTFSLPFALSGSEFERKIYQTLSSFPYAQTLSYQDLALKINAPNSARALGNALGKNPLLLLIPCHRVICKNGKIGNYVLGEEKKRGLLELEKKWSED